MTNANNSALDALNFNVDDLADTPEFRLFPAGTHRVALGLEVRNSKTSGKPMVVWKMTAGETIELQDASAAPLRAKESNTVYFSLANEYGMGALKSAIKPICDALGMPNMKDVIATVMAAETEGSPLTIIVTTTIKPPRKNKPEEQPSLVIQQVMVD